MHTILGILKGVVIGCIVSFIVPYVFSIFMQVAAGGISNRFGPARFYIGFALFIVPTLGYIGYYLSQNDYIGNKKRWKIAIFTASFVTISGNSVGSIIGFKLTIGSLETLNTEAVFWSSILYALCVLPITIPITKYVIDTLYRWIHKRNAYSN